MTTEATSIVRTLHARTRAPDRESSARNLVIVVRADPIICGHSGEARNLAEAAVEAGFEQVHLVTYPLDVLKASGLPLKPLDRVLPYSTPITVERPEPVGDYKVLDGRLDLAISGRIVELLGQHRGTTIVMDLYLVPHGRMVLNAVQSSGSTRGVRVVTVAEAVGSDITNVVANAVDEGRFGAAQILLDTFLAHDVPVAVSGFTRDVIAEAAVEVDRAVGTSFADEVAARVTISYPAIDTMRYTSCDDAPRRVDAVLARRGLRRDGYLLFLSRVTEAKGVEDLIGAYRASVFHGQIPLVVCGTGPGLPAARQRAGSDPHIRFFDDVDDDEKAELMHGCRAYALPTKPTREFTETFGIAAVEKMLAGGAGPLVTTDCGGTREATGGHCLEHVPGDVRSLRATLDRVAELSTAERRAMAQRARRYASRFDRSTVFSGLLAKVDETVALAPMEAML
jgi:glycosyltransferase involved in cell wall biosynthesis